MAFRQELEAFEKTHPYKEKTVDGRTFRYLLCGREDSPHTLVYLVGGSGNPSAWFHHVLAMEGQERVLLCDYPMGVDDMQAMVHLIAGLTEALHIQRAVWIGASMGGYAAQLLAKFYPEKTEALVLYATSCLSRQGIEELKKQYHGMGAVLWALEHLPYGLLKGLLIKPALFHLVPKDSPPEQKRDIREFAQWTCDDYTREKDLHITRLQVSLVDVTPVTQKDFEATASRTLLLLPHEDKAFSAAMQQDLIHTLQGAQVERMDGGHLMTLTHAEECVKRTQGFLKGLDSSPKT